MQLIVDSVITEYALTMLRATYEDRADQDQNIKAFDSCW